MDVHAYAPSMAARLSGASWACLAGTAFVALLVLVLARWLSASRMASSAKQAAASSTHGLPQPGVRKCQKVRRTDATTCTAYAALPPNKSTTNQDVLHPWRPSMPCNTSANSSPMTTSALPPSMQQVQLEPGLQQPEQSYAKVAEVQPLKCSNSRTHQILATGEAACAHMVHQVAVDGASTTSHTMPNEAHLQTLAIKQRYNSTAPSEHKAASMQASTAASVTAAAPCQQQQQDHSRDNGLAPRLSWPQAVTHASLASMTDSASAATQSRSLRPNSTTDGICVHSDDSTYTAQAANTEGSRVVLKTAGSLPNPGQYSQHQDTHGTSIGPTAEQVPGGRVSAQLASIGNSLLASLRRSMSKGAKHERKSAKVMVSGKHGEKRALFNKNKVLPTPTMYAMIHPRPSASTPADTTATATAAPQLTPIAANCQPDPVLDLPHNLQQSTQPPISSPSTARLLTASHMVQQEENASLLHPFLRLHTEHAFAPLLSGLSDASSYQTAASLATSSFRSRDNTLLHTLQQHSVASNTTAGTARMSNFAASISKIQTHTHADDARPHSSSSSLDLLLCSPGVLDAQLPQPADNNTSQQAADLQAGFAIQQAKTAIAAAEAWADVSAGGYSASGLLRSSACSLLTAQDCASPQRLSIPTLDGFNSPARSSTLNPFAASWDSSTAPRETASQVVARIHTLGSEEPMDHVFEDASEGKHGPSSMDSMEALKGRLPDSILGSAPDGEQEADDMAGVWGQDQYAYTAETMQYNGSTDMASPASQAAAAYMWQQMASWGQAVAANQQAGMAQLQDMGMSGPTAVGRPFGHVYNAAGVPAAAAAGTLPDCAMTPPARLRPAAAAAASAGKLSLGVPVFQPPTLLMGPHGGLMTAGVDALGSPRLITAGRPGPMLAVCPTAPPSYHLVNTAAMQSHAMVNLGGGMLLVQPPMQLVQLGPMGMQPAGLLAAPTTIMSPRLSPYKTPLTASVMSVKHAGAPNHQMA